VLEDASAEELAANGDVCAICYSEMEAAKKTRCGHFFHSNCLKRWLFVQDNCPLCTAAIIEVREEQEKVTTPPQGGAGDEVQGARLVDEEVLEEEPAAPTEHRNETGHDGAVEDEIELADLEPENFTPETVDLKEPENYSVEPSDAEKAFNCSLEPLDAEKAFNCSVEPVEAEKALNCSVEPSDAEKALTCSVEPSDAEKALNCSVEPVEAEKALTCSVEPVEAEGDLGSQLPVLRRRNIADLFEGD